MAMKDVECCGDGAGQQATRAESEPAHARRARSSADGPKIVDHKVTLLIAAGAAMAANCEMCLNKIVPDLIEAGVAEGDIRRAVEIGQFVKDKPAGIMKQAADTLTGSRLSERSEPAENGCPADRMKQAAACR